MQMVIAGLVMVCVLVVVHEAGHFLVAKLFGIGTPVFSIGMGPRLFGFTWRGTDYRVSALPVGGYVRMAGADPFGEEDPDTAVPPDEDFMRKPVWQRLLVMFAGPAANLILPFVIFTAVLMLGEPQPDASVGTVLPHTPAAEAGFREGDVVRAVGQREIEVWPDFVRALGDVAEGSNSLPAGDPRSTPVSEPRIPVVVERGGERLTLSLPAALARTVDGFVDTDKLGLWSGRLSSRVGVADPGSPAGQAGLRTGDGILAVDGQEIGTWNDLNRALTGDGPHELRYARVIDGKVETFATTLSPDPSWAPRPDDPVPNPWGFTPVMLHVGAVVPDMPAAEAGLKADDRIYRVDGQPVAAWSQLIDLVGATVEEAGPDAQPRALTVELLRGGELVSVQFVPKVRREIYRGEPRYRPLMGIQQYPDAFRRSPQVKKYYGLFEAVPRATEEGLLVLKGTVGVLGNLLTGELKPKESIGGPIEIFRAAGEGAKEGIFTFARLMGTISFSLGIINLLPVPVLDGGQIVFYTIEGIRGRPLSLELRERVQMVGVLALVAVMLMVTVMDVSRWLGG